MISQLNRLQIRVPCHSMVASRSLKVASRRMIQLLLGRCELSHVVGHARFVGFVAASTRRIFWIVVMVFAIH